MKGTENQIKFATSLREEFVKEATERMNLLFPKMEGHEKRTADYNAKKSQIEAINSTDDAALIIHVIQNCWRGGTMSVSEFCEAFKK